MSIPKSTCSALIVLGLLSVNCSISRGQTTKPSVSPEAQALLGQVREAYANLKSLSITGTSEGDFQIDGTSRNPKTKFSGLFRAGLFRSEVSGDVLAGCTGSKVYCYQPDQHWYISEDAPSPKVDLGTIRQDIADVVRGQDLSLALALSPDAAAELSNGAASITKAPDMDYDGRQLPALTISSETAVTTLGFDPQTHLLVHEIQDMSKMAYAQGAKDVKSAKYTVDFANSPDAELSDTVFAWTPPADAHSPQSAGATPGGTAPAFSLNTLDGKHVSSEDLHGSVYVLDFWATWCGPCVESLPHVDQLYVEMQSQGVPFFAVNEDDPDAADKVKQWVSQNKLSMPVLMDGDQKLFTAYNIQGIPFTAIVGRDGKIIKTEVGAADINTLRDEIVAAAKQK